MEVKEGSGVLNLGDYLSKRIMSEVACGDVLYQNSQSMLCFVSFFIYYIGRVDLYTKIKQKYPLERDLGDKKYDYSKRSRRIY